MQRQRTFWIPVGHPTHVNAVHLLHGGYRASPYSAIGVVGENGDGVVGEIGLEIEGGGMGAGKGLL